MAPKLLISVRSAAEARAALDGGADVIDVKEPSRGSLGRADGIVISEVTHAIAGRRVVSAALGELLDCPPVHEGPSSVDFVKWGLAACERIDWCERLVVAAQDLRPDCRPVAVAYADWQRAGSPPPHEVSAFAGKHRWGAFLLDTWRKDGTTLLDHLALVEIECLVRRCRAHCVPVALAGSLRVLQIADLASFSPDWFAVRGAVCRDGERGGNIDELRVRELAEVVKPTLGRTGKHR